MFNRKTSFVSSLLLLSATAGFTQSGVPQTVTIPQGSSVKLKANSVHASAYQWIKDGVMITGATNESQLVQQAGKYTVVAFNSEGCASEISDPVIVVIDPSTSVVADLSIAKTADVRAVALNDPFEYTLKLKNNGPNVANLVKVQDPLPVDLNFESLTRPLLGDANYNPVTRTIIWDILQLENGADAELKIKVKTNKYGIYSNTATVKANETDPDPANNSATNIKTIIGIAIPNVFTPNGDGKNDSFEIIGLGLYENNELSIVNRLGSPVYEKKGYTNDWTANGLSEGTYFYVLRIKTPSSAWQEFKGYVTVIR